MKQPSPILRIAGSLWIAAVLLAALMIAMGSATAFESVHGTERALADFYTTWWFQGLLALGCLNILCAIALRLPLSRDKMGFFLTHGGIVLVLVGALVTRQLGVQGRVAIVEGETVKEFRVPESTLIVSEIGGTERKIADLESSVFGGFDAVERPISGAFDMGSLEGVEILEYVPDLVLEPRVTDDSPHPHPAVEVSLSPDGVSDPVWLYAGEVSRLGSVNASYRVGATDEEIEHLAHDHAGTSHSAGTLNLQHDGNSYRLAVEDCTDGPAKIGDTGYTVRVLRYFTHAVVGDNGTVTNGSQRATNPAVEVEIVGPSMTEKRLSFARFPDNPMSTGAPRIDAIDLKFDASGPAPVRQPLEIVAGPEGRLHARFAWEGTKTSVLPLEPGTVIDSPWPGMRICAVRRFENARRWTEPLTPDPPRPQRDPAILLALGGAEDRQELWLRKHETRRAQAGGRSYEIYFGDKPVPLGFEVRLDQFEVRYYPGGESPRSFESSLTVTDPGSGARRKAVVSMNHPLEFGGFAMYQSSYRMTPERKTTILSVSRDPGRPVVFAGYIVTFVGMLVVLGIRLRDRRTIMQIEQEQMRNQEPIDDASTHARDAARVVAAR